MLRLRPDSGESGAVGDAAYLPAGVHAGAIGDPTGWHDEQLGQIFRNMRLAMKVSRETIARRLATSTASVDSFESGAIGALPHGKETERIVRGYCELLRIDPQPILWRIRTHMQAMASHAQAAEPATALPSVAESTTSGRPTTRSRQVARSERSEQTQGGRSKAERTQVRSPGRRRRARALFALSTPVALVAALIYVAHAAPRSAYRAIALLPSPVEAAVRAGFDYLVLLTAARRDGLRWVEVGDPRLRKADRLQAGAR
jgi:hypothetical protein